MSSFITRRDALQLFAAGGLGSVIGSSNPATPVSDAVKPQSDTNSPKQKRNPRQPNILVIMTDQHSSHVAGCYGDPVVRTPNLDALAARGVLFENAYCAAPVCVPSRMSFLTGRSPSQNQVWTNDDTLPSDRPTFAHALGAAGYETALIGRMHFLGPDQNHGFDQRLVGDVVPSYPDGRIGLSQPLIPGAANVSVQVAGPGKTGYQAYDTDVTSAAVDYLHSAAHGDKPFCAVVGFVLPHPPFVCSREDWDYYYHRVSIPEVPTGYLNHLHPAVQTWRKDYHVVGLTQEEIRRGRVGYYGIVSEMDRNVGKILDALKQSGLDDNTIIVYVSDHGEMAGENDMWWKFNFYEGSVKVPLIISCPSKFPVGQRRSEVVSLMDVAPSLCEIAGASPMPDSPGRSLRPLIAGEKISWENPIFSELPANYHVPAVRMVRRGDWKLVHFDGMRPQLFNLKDDPHEFNDLGEDATHGRIREKLSALATANWSASEINSEVAARDRERVLITEWARQTHPPDPDLWKAPPGANVFPEDDSAEFRQNKNEFQM